MSTYATMPPDVIGQLLTNETRKTKVVATLGPASVPLIPEMIEAGVNCFRFNFSHVADPTTQIDILEKVRTASKALGVPVACLADMGGPKIRCNTFSTASGTVSVSTGRKIRIKLSDEPGDESVITTSIPQLFKQLEPGMRLLMDDGNLTTTVTKRISDTEMELECQNAWVIKSKKGINTPDIALDIPAITDKDKRDLSFAWAYRFDYIALSFVQRDTDILEGRRLMEDLRKMELSQPLPPHSAKIEVDLHTWRPFIISKIETPGALENIAGIIEATDGIMVARGDLAVEVGLTRVPAAQKALIKATNLAGKPVITATQMLESMISAPVPTRAEVSDVSNAVFDGTDAVMLSGEAAVGQYPVLAVKTMAQVAKAADRHRFKKDIPPADENVGMPMGHNTRDVPESYRHAIADATVSAADRAGLAAIVAFTESGDMAALLSKRKPSTPILALTGNEAVRNQLVLYSGVTPVYIPMLSHATGMKIPKASLMDLESCLAEAEAACATFVKEGDKVAFTAGFFSSWPALSDSVRLTKFGEATRAKKAKDHWSSLSRTLAKSASFSSSHAS